MKHIFQLIIGDWSQDGHNQTERVIVKANKEPSEIIESYRVIERKSGISLDKNTSKGCSQILGEYEESNIDPESIKKLKDAGVEIPDGDDEDNEDGSVWMDPERVVQLFMNMAKAHIPDLEYKILQDEIPTINGFWKKELGGIGYGLFN